MASNNKDCFRGRPRPLKSGGDYAADAVPDGGARHAVLASASLEGPRVRDKHEAAIESLAARRGQFGRMAEVEPPGGGHAAPMRCRPGAVVSFSIGRLHCWEIVVKFGQRQREGS